MRSYGSRWFALFVVVAVGVYSWVAAGLRPFTSPIEVMVAIPAIVVLVAAWLSRAADEHTVVRSSRASAALWLGLVVLALGWELYAFFSLPRADHPTLSVIADEIMSVHPGRALIFVLWLMLGWLLVASSRTDTR